MSMQVQPYNSNNVIIDQSWIEQIILKLADAFDIRLVWDADTAVLTGAFALAGGVIGGIAGGRIGAAVGAGISGAAGLGISTIVSLREIWSTVKEKLKELIYVVVNYLRRVDPEDYVRAFEIVMRCMASRKELVITIVDFIIEKLGRVVLSNITAS